MSTCLIFNSFLSVTLSIVSTLGVYATDSKSKSAFKCASNNTKQLFKEEPHCFKHIQEFLVSCQENSCRSEDTNLLHPSLLLYIIASLYWKVLMWNYIVETVTLPSSWWRWSCTPATQQRSHQRGRRLQRPARALLGE